MKILIIIQWCKPEPDFKCIPMAKALQALGHDVEVLTGFPNYPGGSIYPGYQISFLQRELIDNVPVIRVPVYPSHNSSSIKRALNYLSFALSSAIIGPFVTSRSDVVYVYNPMGFTGIIFKALKRTPFVYDIQDIWPDSIVSSGFVRLGSNILSLLSFFFSWFYSSASKIIVQSQGFKSILEDRGVQSSKLEVLYNWCNEESLSFNSSEDPRWKDCLVIAYSGNIGASQSLNCVIDVAQSLQFTNPHIHFVFIGAGTELESLKARSFGLQNVSFISQVPQSELSSFLNNADALLVHLVKDPLFDITIPSKVQFYLASGKPILAGVSGEACQLIERSGSGFVFEPENSKSLLDAILKLNSLPRSELALIGAKARKYYFEEFSLSVAATRLESIFLSAIDSFNSKSF